MKSELEAHIATLITNGHFDIIRRDTGLIVIGSQYAHFTGKHISFGYGHKEKISKQISKIIKSAFDGTTGQARVH